MIKTKRFLIGTVRECVTEIVNMINWEKSRINNFDFCCYPYDDITKEDINEADDGSDLGESWYGCKNVASAFNGEREGFSLLFGYYGTCFNELVNIIYDEKNETGMIINRICDAIYSVTLAGLTKDSDTIFEFYPYNAKGEA